MTITDESVGVSVFKGARALAALPKSTHMLHVYSNRPTPQLSRGSRRANRSYKKFG